MASPEPAIGVFTPAATDSNGDSNSSDQRLTGAIGDIPRTLASRAAIRVMPRLENGPSVDQLP